MALPTAAELDYSNHTEDDEEYLCLPNPGSAELEEEEYVCLRTCGSTEQEEVMDEDQQVLCEGSFLGQHHLFLFRLVCFPLSNFC